MTKDLQMVRWVNSEERQVVNDLTPDNDPTFVWQGSIATMFALLALGFALFAVSAAQSLADNRVALHYGGIFATVSVLLIASAAACWFRRWWLTIGFVLASFLVFVLGMPDR